MFDFDEYEIYDEESAREFLGKLKLKIICWVVALLFSIVSYILSMQFKKIGFAPGIIAGFIAFAFLGPAKVLYFLRAIVYTIELGWRMGLTLGLVTAFSLAVCFPAFIIGYVGTCYVCCPYLGVGISGIKLLLAYRDTKLYV